MLSTNNPIDKQIIQLKEDFNFDNQIERKIQIILERMVRSVYQDAVTQAAGWCATLKTPETDVMSLFNLLKLDKQEVQSAFIKQFNLDATFKMWGHSYYHILLLLMAYGIHFANPEIAKNSAILILVRLWNGRKLKAIQYCDPGTMRYVIANLSKKSYFKVYDSPMSLIMNRLVPSLLESYSNRIIDNTQLIKRFFDQSYGRLYQLFYQSSSPDLKTGEVKAKAGIAPLYYAAKEKGYKIGTAKMRADIDTDIPVTDVYGSGEYDDLIDNIESYIVMNSYPKYDSTFYNFIFGESHVPLEGIKLLSLAIHNINYSKHMHEILSLMFKQIGFTHELEVCKSNFISEIVKKKIISSKHTPYIVQLKAIIDDLIEKIFVEKVKNTKYEDYSTPVRGQLRKVLIYIISYNMQKYICTQKRT